LCSKNLFWLGGVMWREKGNEDEERMTNYDICKQRK
jgi:hypothetical protein